MLLSFRSPTARAAARSYCRRCLAVMLCCVLVFGLTVRTAPKAEAVVAEGALAGVAAGGSAAAGGLAAAPVAAVVGLLALGICGVSFASGYFQAGPDNVFYGTRGYDLGYDCMEYLKGLGGDLYDWYSETVSKFEAAGGVKPGDTLTIPPEVAEAIRQWAVTNIDFTDGKAVYTQSGIYTDSGFLMFSQFPAGAVYGESYYYANYGTVITCPPAGQTLSYRFEDKNGDVFRYDFYLNSKSQFQLDWYKNDTLVKTANWSQDTSFTFVLAPESARTSRYLAIRPSGRNFSEGRYYEVQYLTGYYDSGDLFIREENMPLDTVFDVPTTLTKTPALEEEKTQDLVVTVPGEIPTQQVGGYEIPVLGDVSADVLTPGLDVPGTDVDTPAMPGITAGEITGAIEAALPVTGAAAGDAVVGEALAEPDSLGAVFISKFPFCIPWDIFRALKLLAAPPVTPRWEVDFLAPIADKVGGWNGDTTVVIDFGKYPIVGVVTRWLSTILFGYALASATKKLIWTA